MGGGSGLVSGASNAAKQNQATTAAQTGALESSISGNVSPTFNAANNVGTNLASTGGFNPTQANQFLEQATSGTNADYGILQQQAQQQRDKTGGLGSGGEISQMARQLGQAQASNTLGAETTLNQLQTSNEATGAQIESGLYGQTLNSILQAMGINTQSQGQEDQSLTSLATSPVSNKSWFQNMWGALGFTPGQLLSGGGGSGSGGGE